MKNSRLGKNPLTTSRPVSKHVVSPKPSSLGPCTLCKKITATESCQPQCAFLSDDFSLDNWNCRTLRALRLAANHLGTVSYSVDHAAALVPIPHPISESSDDDELRTHVVLHWYKSRGQTQAAYQVAGDGHLTPLDRRLAELLAAYYLANPA